MTDWYGGDHGDLQVCAGNDMIQPGTRGQYDAIIEAVNAGTLDVADLDRNVKRILSLIVRTPRFKAYAYGNKPDLEAHAAVTRQSALEGMVLLENRGGTLPLSSEVHDIALFGNASFSFIAGGTGSGNVNRAYTVSLLDGLKNAGYTVDERLKDAYSEARDASKKAWDATPMTHRWRKYLPVPLPEEIVPSDAEINAMVEANDVAIITLNRLSGEFLDRSSADFNLSAAENVLIHKVCGAFHKQGKKVVVILNVGGVIETASWKSLPDAVLCAWQAGQEGGNSVADILSGRQSPSGKLPMTWPIGLMDAASSANFPIDVESSINIMDRREDVGEKNVDYTEYEEGIYVGYRWFDKAGLEVSYPFGYGLSYTSFEYSDPFVEGFNGGFKASVKVTNTGAVAAKEAVQLYVSAPSGGLDKPVRELKAYGKTGVLEPGASQVLSFVISRGELASYDEADGAWVTAGGKYELQFGSSSRDIRCSINCSID